MVRLNIQISEDVNRKLQLRANESGHATVEEFVEELVRNEADVDYGAPAHLRVETREQLEAMIEEGMASPAREMNWADWEAGKKRLIDKHSQNRNR